MTPTSTREDTVRALKRMLTNGPLTALPKRSDDQALLLELAIRRFEADREYREPEVNDVLVAWLETFVAPYGVDHVTLRRMLVDARHLVRDKAGLTYRRAAEPVDGDDVDPAQVLAEARAEREARKQARPR